MKPLPSFLLGEIFSFSLTLDICHVFAYVSKYWNLVLKLPNVWKTKWVKFSSIEFLKRYLPYKKNLPLTHIQILFSIYDIKVSELIPLKEMKYLKELKFSYSEMDEKQLLFLDSLDLPITELVLCPEVSEESLVKLAKFKLKTLYLTRWARVTNFNQIVKMPLETLSFHTYNFLFYPIEFENFIFLRNLHLCSVKITLQNFLLSLPPSLESLSLINIQIMDQYDSLTLLTRLINLKTLELQNFKQNLQAFDALFRLDSLNLHNFNLSKKNIEEMLLLKNIRYFQIDIDGDYYFPFTNLIYLKLSGKIMKSDLMLLFPSLSTLTKLCLDFKYFVQSAVDKIGTIKSLKHLYISYLSEKGLTFSLQFLNNIELQSLTLTSDHHWSYLSLEIDYVNYGSFPILPTLTFLSLKNLNIGDNIFKLLPHFVSVSTLDLYGCRNLTNQSVFQIKLKFPVLKKLIIKYTSIRNVTDLLGHEHLRYIEIPYDLEMDKLVRDTFILHRN